MSINQLAVGNVVEWDTVYQKVRGTIVAIENDAYVIEYSPWCDRMSVPITEAGLLRRIPVGNDGRPES